MEKFGSRLRRLRRIAGLTQEQLAHACNYSGQSRIANYESLGKNARLPSLAEIPVLARALGVKEAELVASLPPGIAEDHGTYPQIKEPAISSQVAADLQLVVALMAQSMAATIPPAGMELANALARLRPEVRKRDVIAKTLAAIQGELRTHGVQKRRPRGSIG